MYKIQASLMEKNSKEALIDKWFINFVCVLLFIFCVFLFITKIAFMSVYVDGSSMYPTLKSGDVLFVSKSTDFEVGDIVVIDGEKKNVKGGYDWLIKRVIAVGEKDKTVVVEIKDGSVFVGYKGEQLVKMQENYLPEGTFTDFDYNNAKGKQPYWELKEGQVFYLGDNRNASSDSRGDYDLCESNQIIGIVDDWALSFRWLSGFIFDLGQIFRN